MKIAIDAGHGAKPDIGASGCGKLEDNLTFELSKKVGQLLQAKGNQVFYVRPLHAVSVTNSLNQRCISSDTHKCDLYVSLHFNASDGKGHGTEVFCNINNPKGKTLATNIVNNLSKAFGYSNRGVKDGLNTEPLYVIKHPRATSILIETCFIDNKNDMAKYNADKAALVISNCINTYK